MSGTELTSVGYKKGNWMRYSLWAIAAICVGVLVFMFINTLNNQATASVPDGYKFSIVDSHTDGGCTTYYVYDNKIIVKDEAIVNGQPNQLLMVYGDVNTSSLKLDEFDTTEICELGKCQSRPKVLVTIKKILSHKIGREYVGF